MTPRIDLRPAIHDPVVLMISRRQVEHGDVGSVVKGLQHFTATREDARLYRGQMSLVVSGYEDDPREIVDIPEGSCPRKWCKFFSARQDAEG